MTTAARLTPAQMMMVMSRERAMLSLAALLRGPGTTEPLLQHTLALTTDLMVIACKNVFYLHLRAGTRYASFHIILLAYHSELLVLDGDFLRAIFHYLSGMRI